MWFNNFINSRMPVPVYQIRDITGGYSERSIIGVTITPTRIAYPYTVSAIQSPIPLYKSISQINEKLGGLNILGTGEASLSESFLFEPLFISPKNELLKKEKYIEFYYDRADLQGKFTSIRLDFRSEHFPFHWAKQIKLS